MTEEIPGCVSTNTQFNFERCGILPIPSDSLPVIIQISSVSLFLLFVNYDTKISQNSGGFAHSELVPPRHSILITQRVGQWHCHIIGTDELESGGRPCRQGTHFEDEELKGDT